MKIISSEDFFIENRTLSFVIGSLAPTISYMVILIASFFGRPPFDSTVALIILCLILGGLYGWKKASKTNSFLFMIGLILVCTLSGRLISGMGNNNPSTEGLKPVVYFGMFFLGLAGSLSFFIGLALLSFFKSLAINWRSLQLRPPKS